ncbi:MAG: hypothetical protein IK094_10080 [Treponema sp.]|nr:hypothetical protein [Treponema sp.]
MFNDVAEFDETIKKEWPSPVMYDGITNLERYKKAKCKILWILKETNENENDEDRCHREFHEDVTVYKNWKRTYKKIILTSCEILNDKSFFDERDGNLEDKCDVLNDVAFINVNKTGSTSQSNGWHILECYQKHKETLLAQIDGIEPDVIINCSRVGEVFEDVSKKYSLAKKQFTTLDKYVINYASNGKMLMIDYWHPNARITDEWYCSQIFDIYKMWAKH